MLEQYDGRERWAVGIVIFFSPFFFFDDRSLVLFFFPVCGETRDLQSAKVSALCFSHDRGFVFYLSFFLPLSWMTEAGMEVTRAS